MSRGSFRYVMSVVRGELRGLYSGTSQPNDYLDAALHHAFRAGYDAHRRGCMCAIDSMDSSLKPRQIRRLLREAETR